MLCLRFVVRFIFVNMKDVHSKEVRSYNMSRIRSKNTQPELIVRKFLHAQGFRYRIHDNKLTGKPDIILPKYKTIVFIHGCFWHNHSNCRYAKFPKLNSDYWIPKILNNISKDAHSIKALKKEGWKVIVLWTCKLKKQLLDKTLASLSKKISQSHL